MEPANAHESSKSILMLVPGIKGSVTEKGYEGWLKIISAQWGAKIYIIW